MEKVMEPVFFAGFLTPSSLACTDPANWKTCQGLSHQRKLEKMSFDEIYTSATL
jgi:hypothetical protein